MIGYTKVLIIICASLNLLFFLKYGANPKSFISRDLSKNNLMELERKVKNITFEGLQTDRHLRESQIIIEHSLIHPPQRLNRRINQSPSYKHNYRTDLFLQNIFIDEEDRTNKFFIECGANDGVTASNKLDLELYHGWTGILIEGSPWHRKILTDLRRNAWIVPHCLSLEDRLTSVEFLLDGGSEGSIKSNKNNPKSLSGATQKVICYPFHSILEAVRKFNNFDRIDLFRLDVEGHEYEILATIDFSKIQISVINVEVTNVGFKSDHRVTELMSLLENNGFVAWRSVERDIIFVQKDIFKARNLVQEKITKANFAYYDRRWSGAGRMLW